jgi:hypothetical protein
MALLSEGPATSRWVYISRERLPENALDEKAPYPDLENRLLQVLKKLRPTKYSLSH